MQSNKSSTKKSSEQLTESRHCFLRYLGWSVVGVVGFLLIGALVALLTICFLRKGSTVTGYLTYPTFVCSSRACGCPKWNQSQSLAARIVGGNDASPYFYPWLVALVDRHRTDPFCAGFIISPDVVLTAAHCLNDRQPNRVQILSKLHDLRAFDGERHEIDQWTIHADYRMDDSSHLNDIALIKVQQTFANDLQACCLPSTSSTRYPRVNSEVVVSGWGRRTMTANSRNSPILQHAVMPIVDHRNLRCQRSIADVDRQICAGYDTLSIDACSGDSGAPLLAVEYEGNRGYFVAAGIVSYGNKQCDASISSGVYTRVSFYLDWINQNLKLLKWFTLYERKKNHFKQFSIRCLENIATA